MLMKPFWEELAPLGKLLRPHDVVERTGLSRSQIYQMIAEKRFPPFVKLSTRASALPEAWLDRYVELQVEQALSSG